MDAQEIDGFVDAQLRQSKSCTYGFGAPQDFVKCGVCSHNWHGLKCLHCGCQTSSNGSL